MPFMIQFHNRLDGRGIHQSGTASIHLQSCPCGGFMGDGNSHWIDPHARRNAHVLAPGAFADARAGLEFAHCARDGLGIDALARSGRPNEHRTRTIGGRGGWTFWAYRITIGKWKCGVGVASCVGASDNACGNNSIMAGCFHLIGRQRIL